MDTDLEIISKQFSTLKTYQDALPKLELESGTKIFVRINPVNQNGPPIQGEFLGVSHYDFIIFRLPSVPGLLNRLIPHTMIGMSFVQHGAIHTFTSELLSYSLKPALILYAGYPDRIQITESRVYRRVVCALPIVLNSRCGKAEGIITDLSKGGCRMTFDLTGQSCLLGLEVDDEIAVHTVFSALGTLVGSPAVIRNIEGRGTRLRIGIAFKEESAGFQTALENYLELARALS